MPKTKTLRTGDVAKLPTGDHVAFLQYIGKHVAGQMVAVIPGLFNANQCIDIDAVLESSGVYPILYPLGASTRQGLAVIVDNKPALLMIPEETRRPIFAVGGGIEGWFIDNRDGSTTVTREPLTERERRLPLRVMFSHDVILNRIREKWNPINYV